MMSKESLRSVALPFAFALGEIAYHAFAFDQREYFATSILEQLMFYSAITTVPQMFLKSVTEKRRDEAAWLPMLEQLQRERPLHKPVVLRTSKDSDFFGFSLGHNLGTLGDAVILVPPDSANLTDEERFFILAHEYSHLLNNDCIEAPFYAAAAQLLAGGIFYFTADPNAFRIVNALKFGMLMKAVSTVTSLLISQKNERRADHTAFTFDQDRSRKGAISLFEKAQKNHKNFRSSPERTVFNSALKKLFIRPNGDYLRDIKHPFLSTRIKYARRQPSK